MAERPRKTQLPGTFSVEGYVETVAAGTAKEVPVWINNTGAKVKVTKAAYLPDTALTGNGTDGLLLQFRNKNTTGTGTTGITSIKTYGTGTDIAVLVEDSLVLSTTAADLEVSDGQVVALNKTEAGSGTALPAGIATIEFQFSV